MSFPRRGMVFGGSWLARLQNTELTGQSGDGFVGASDVTDNVPGRPGGSAKWPPALMQQRLQKESLMNVFQGERKFEKERDK